MPVVTYKCPNCDGELVFDPGKQKFSCEYCDSLFDLEELEHQGNQKEAAPEPQPQKREADPDDEFYHHAVEYVCPSCGAEVVVDDTMAATACYYCHNPVVLSGRLSGTYRPQRVVPFSITKERVEQEFLTWCRKKRFMKKDFFSLSQREKLVGVYLPFWLIDCTTDARMRAKGRKVRVWRTGNMEYTETEEYELIREGEIDFTELPLAALDRKEVELTKGIAPYDLGKAVDFSMAYLSGFQAQKRNLERDQLEPAAKDQLNGYSRMLLSDTISGYSGVSVQELNNRMMREDWSYTLLPVWALTYQYKGKDYYFAMNGQTGKVCGEVPLSFGRLAILFGIVAAVAFAILMLGGWLL